MTPENARTGDATHADAVLTGSKMTLPFPLIPPLLSRDQPQPDPHQAPTVFGEDLDTVRLLEHRPSARHWGINE